MPNPNKPISAPQRAAHWGINLVIMTLIRSALLLPYERRVRAFGWLISRVIGPVAGYQRRALKHLAVIYHDRSPAERKALARACLDNVGRALIEAFSTLEFFERMSETKMQGPGVEALRAAHERGQSVILVTGHFGNYEAARASMIHHGYTIGAIYRYMANPYFNAHYVKALHAYGGPGFAQGRRGTAAAVRHLKDSGKLILLFDQHVMGAPVLDFLGHPARTAISAAQLALKYDAVVIPYYAIRKEDGLSFDCVFEEPIPHSTAEEMTQAMNDSIEKRILAHPEQWFWVPRRWRAKIK